MAKIQINAASRLKATVVHAGNDKEAGKLVSFFESKIDFPYKKSVEKRDEGRSVQKVTWKFPDNSKIIVGKGTLPFVTLELTRETGFDWSGTTAAQILKKVGKNAALFRVENKEAAKKLYELFKK